MDAAVTTPSPSRSRPDSTSSATASGAGTPTPTSSPTSPPASPPTSARNLVAGASPSPSRWRSSTPASSPRRPASSSNSTDRLTKVCVPSPYLLGVRLWEEAVSTKAYPTRDEFIDALVPILHEELVALQDTGVTVVQIDEPHLCVLVDPSYRDSFDDPRYEMDLAADKINEILDGIDGVQTALHLCRRNWGRRGWGAEGGYEPIIETMKKINVDQYVMEFSIPVAGDVAILRELPDDKLIGLGAVECRFEKIDTTEEIVARVEEAMKHVDPERLSLNPDCGFAPGLAIDMPLEEPYLKLKNEAEAARRLRGLRSWWLCKQGPRGSCLLGQSHPP